MTSESREAIKKVLQHSQTPKSLPQIRKELPDTLRISSKALAASLGEMAAAGEIFSWPRKKFWDHDPRQVVPRLILEFLDSSPAVAAAKMRTALKLPPEVIQPALEELVGRGRVHVWQTGKTPYYCLLEPRDAALDTIVKALADGPLTEKELISWVRKKLPGYQARHFKEHVSPSERILEHPKYGKEKARFGLRPPEPGPYLDKAVREIETVHKVLAPFRVSLAAVFDALKRRFGLEEKTTAFAEEKSEGERPCREAERVILEGVSRLQPFGQRRALVSIRELRRSLNLPKSDFDRAVLSLALQGRVALHHHDFPTSLNPTEREELVRDKQGTYYVGIVPKETS